MSRALMLFVLLSIAPSLFCGCGSSSDEPAQMEGTLDLPQPPELEEEEGV